MTKSQRLTEMLVKKPKRTKRGENQRVYLAVYKDWKDDFWDETRNSTGIMTKASSVENLLRSLPSASEVDALSWGVILCANGFKNREEAVIALKNYYEDSCGGTVSVGEDNSWTLWKVNL